jgi:uncharacterized protein YqeY
MSLKEQIDRDIKTAMLAGDKTLVTTLRGLKSSILYAEVAKGSRDVGLPDDEVVSLFQKEAKKRQESADLYKQGGNQDKQQAELEEKKVIERYLPAQMDEEQVRRLVDDAVSQMGDVSVKDMGKIIGAVKAKTGSAADGSVIARLVKEKLTA